MIEAHPARTAAAFFLRYLVFGIGLLAIVVFAVKPLIAGSVYLPQYVAAGIIAINFITVVGFTLAVLRGPDLLADQDAPDLAYYLGFSLTVAALSITFLSDVALVSGQDAEGRSRLVTGALAQFGAGLVATLIGLCSKILLTARQQKTQTDPEAFYARLRFELGEVSLTIRNVTTELTAGIQDATGTMRRAAKAAETSMQELAKSLKESSDLIAANVTPEKISKPVEAFAAELGRLSPHAASTRESLVSLEQSTRAMTSSVDAANKSMESTANVSRRTAELVGRLSDAALQLKESIGQLLGAITSHAAAEGQITAVLAKSAEQAGVLTTSMSGLGAGIQELGRSMAESGEPLVRSLSATTQELSSLRSEAGNAVLALGSMAGETSQLDGSMRQLGRTVTAHVEAEERAIETVTQAGSTITAFSAEMQALAHRVQELARSVSSSTEPLALALTATAERMALVQSESARLAPALAAAGSAAAPFASAMTALNGPLVQNRESLQDFQREVAAAAAHAGQLYEAIQALAAATQGVTRRSAVG